MIAIAADTVEDTKLLQAQLTKIPLFTDLDLSATTAWGLRPPGAEHPSPGTFVVSRDGNVQWRRLEDKNGDWPTYPELAAALK